jgi:hypothetical protein
MQGADSETELAGGEEHTPTLSPVGMHSVTGVAILCRQIVVGDGGMIIGGVGACVGLAAGGCESRCPGLPIPRATNNSIGWIWPGREFVLSASIAALHAL